MYKLFCGIDLGTRSSSFCIIDQNQAVKRRWSGANKDLINQLKEHGQALQCVVEASPLAETVCNQVESIGGKIEVVDSRHTKALLHGKKKTDRIDAQVLAELACRGWYKAIYRKSGYARAQRTVLGARASVVRVSIQLKNTIRGLLKANGMVLPARCEGDEFIKAVQEITQDIASEVREAIEQLLNVWSVAYKSQKATYKKLAKAAKAHPVASKLLTAPGVGPATAICFAATIAAHERFQHAKQVVGYIGLAPRVYQSGATEYNGRITKQGDKLLRWLLVESANSLLSRTKKSSPLKEWGLKLAERKGLAKAKIAIARKLAILLFTLWRKNQVFLPKAA